MRPDGSLAKQKAWSVAGVVPEDDCLIAVMPDWKGRIWFFTQQGVVGTISTGSGKVRTVHLPAGEEVTNSVSTDETGGMYVVSTHALYRLDAKRRGAGRGTPKITWREVYDRGSRTKPGNLSQGSGTTPTLIGKKWVAINDNADPKTQVVVYDRRRAAGPEREHCSIPVLAAGAGTTDNSLVAAGRSLIIENNYGYGGPATTLGGKSTTPGLAQRPDPQGRLQARVDQQRDRADARSPRPRSATGSSTPTPSRPAPTAWTPGTSPPSTCAPARPGGAGSPAPAPSGTTTTPRSTSAPTARCTSPPWPG